MFELDENFKQRVSTGINYCSVHLYGRPRDTQGQCEMHHYLLKLISHYDILQNIRQCLF